MVFVYKKASGLQVPSRPDLRISSTSLSNSPCHHLSTKQSINLPSTFEIILSICLLAQRSSSLCADASVSVPSHPPAPAGSPPCRSRQASPLELSEEGMRNSPISNDIQCQKPTDFQALLLTSDSVFGFLTGSVAAGASVYYYILAEYRLANEMLSDDISVCL